MRLWFAFRIAISVLSAPALWILILNVEKFAEERGWDLLLTGLSQTPISTELARSLTSPFGFAGAAFTVGITLGAWIHFWVGKWDRTTSDIRSDSKTSDYSELARLMLEGETLNRRCYDGEEPVEDLTRWRNKTYEYLNKTHSELAASRFISDADTPATVMIGKNSALSSNLWQQANRRLSKLEKIASDLRLSS